MVSSRDPQRNSEARMFCSQTTCSSEVRMGCTGSAEPDLTRLLHFIEMTRNPTFVVLSMVVPSFLLSLISFAQFWVPAQETINLDRGGIFCYDHFGSAGFT